jgi:hypothetical protein
LIWVKLELVLLLKKNVEFALNSTSSFLALNLKFEYEISSLKEILEFERPICIP